MAFRDVTAAPPSASCPAKSEESPCTGFKLAYGRPAQAKMKWFVGDNHRLPVLDCLEILSKGTGNHIMYFEGVEAGNIVPCDTLNVGLKNKQGRTCKGWDNMTAFDKETSYQKNGEKNLMRILIKNQLLALKREYPENEPDVNFAPYIKKNERKLKAELRQLTALPQTQDNVRSIRETRASLGAIKWIEDLRKKGKTYQQAFNIPYEVHNEPLVTFENFIKDPKDLDKLNQATDERNQALSGTIKSHPEDETGIWLAGAEHLIPRKEGSRYRLFSREVENIKNYLEKNKTKRPFAVLVHETYQPR